jgi:DNA-binding response OmpR family regulator
VPRFLIASADAGTREFLRRAFAKFAVEAEECEGATEAFAQLHRRYDGVVLDCEDVELAVQLVSGIRSNNAVGEGTPTSVIALLPGEAPLHPVLSAGAVLALHKPLRRLEPLVAGMRMCFRLTPAAEKPPAKPATGAKEQGRAAVAARPEVSRK